MAKNSFVVEVTSKYKKCLILRYLIIFSGVVLIEEVAVKFSFQHNMSLILKFDDL